jgi:hypothetical protein
MQGVWGRHRVPLGVGTRPPLKHFLPWVNTFCTSVICLAVAGVLRFHLICTQLYNPDFLEA